MKNVRLLFIGIIFSHFVLKIANKLRHPEQLTKEETYRAMRDAREQWLREHRTQSQVAEVDGKLMARDPSAALASIEQANLNIMGSCAR